MTLFQRPFYGSPHEHQLQPSYALFVGDISAQSHPPLYVACVGAAFQWYRSQGAAASEALVAGRDQLPPLVINTPGWVKVLMSPPCTQHISAAAMIHIVQSYTYCWSIQTSIPKVEPDMLNMQGIGLDMLADSVRTVQPSHVLQLQSRVNNRNLPESSWWRPQGDPGAASAAPAHYLLPAYEAVQDAVPSSNPAADLGCGIQTHPYQWMPFNNIIMKLSKYVLCYTYSDEI